MRPLQIALVTTELRVGGAERCVTRLAAHLNRDEFAPTVYSLAPRPEPPYDELVRRLEQAEVPVVFLECRRPRQILRAIRRLSGHWKAARPDVVQSFLYHANVVTAWTARRCGLTSHLAIGLRVAEWNRRRMWLEKRIGRHAQVAVCVSRAVADFYQRHTGWPPDRFRVIANGIDLSEFDGTPADLTPLGIAKERRVVACVGRLHPQKGLDELLGALPPLLARFPDTDLLLIGDGPQRSELETQAARLGISHRVVFAGWQSDVPDLLRAATLLLLPSRYEGMPNVLLEAMAAGLPVAAFEVEGVAEVLGPLTSDQTAPRGELEPLLERAADWLADPLRAAEVGRKNQAHVAAQFSLETMTSQYTKLFRELAGPKKNS